MAEPKTRNAKKWLYFSTGIFSVAWFCAYTFGVTRTLDDSWGDMWLRLSGIFSGYNRDGDQKQISPPDKRSGRLADPRITISAIDDYTLSRYGWPVKRRYYGALVAKLKKLGVKAVGVNVMLFDPDRDNPENDRAYVEEVARAGNVVNLVLINDKTLDPQLPLKGLAEGSAYLAQPRLETDGYVRKAYMFHRGSDANGERTEDRFLTYKDLKAGKLRCDPGCGDRIIPSFSMAVYAVFSGDSLLELNKEYGKKPLLLNYRYPIFRKAHPAWNSDPQNRILSAYRHISVADILEDRLNPAEKEALAGGITLLGSSATGVYDYFPSPFMAQFPGVEVHATVIDNVIHGDQIKKADATAMAILGLLLPWAAIFLGRYPLKAALPLSFVLMASVLGADIYLRVWFYEMPFITVMLAFFIPFSCVVVNKKIRDIRLKESYSNLAAQAAHDIKSPLAALDSALRDLSVLPQENQELAQGAMARIGEITHGLLEDYKKPEAKAGPSEKTASPQDLKAILKPMLSEKRAQYASMPDLSIDLICTGEDARANVQPAEFRRIISNLVNNAVEAFEKGGRVVVELLRADTRILVKVSDNGKGIPAEILSKLGQKGGTYGKASGTGLGLYHARTMVESWGGSFRIESRPGAGTTVVLALPEITGMRQTVLVDNDALVRMNWKTAAKVDGAALLVFSSPGDFFAADPAVSKDASIYIDSDLGNGIKGEDLAQTLKTKGYTDICLETGHAPEKFKHIPWLKVTGKEPPWGRA